MSSTRQQEISTTQTTESAKKEPVGVTLEGLMALGMDEAMAKAMLETKEKKETSAKDERHLWKRKKHS